MPESNNNLLNAIDQNSEENQNITESEWNKINKDNLFSKIKNSDIKAKLESKYDELDAYFQQEGEQIHETTIQDLQLFKESFQSKEKTPQDIKNELISKYSSEYKELQSDVVSFLDSAFDNSLSGELGDLNADKFDNKDQQEGFSEYELEEYTKILDKAMKHMNILGSYANFKKKYIEIGKDPSFMSWKGDIALSNAIDLQEHIFGEGEKHLTDNVHSYSEEELHTMKEEKFDVTDSDKMKNFFILLGIELGEGIEDVLKFIGNIPAGLIVLPRYVNNRVILSDGEVNTQEEVEAQMENDMLTKENPALMICELLGEKGVQMIKQLGEMFVSGKNGDITMILVTIAGLIAGGAGAVKFGAKMGKLSKVEKIASKVQKSASRVDDIVGGAGIGHMTGAFSVTPEGRISTGVASEKVLEANGKLSEAERFSKAEELLGKELSPEQKESLLKAHNYPQGDNIAKGMALMKGGFTKAEAQILMDQGVVGIFGPFGRKMKPSVEENSSKRIWRSDKSEFGSTSFEKIQDFDELENYIRNLPEGGLRGSEDFYSSDDLLHIIDEVKGGRYSLSSVTSTGNLREKVRELLGSIYKEGENITITRSNGDLQKAIIVGINPDGRVIVKWDEFDQTMGKTISIDNIVNTKIEQLKIIEQPFGHGSSSGSLIGVVHNNGLVPTGELLNARDPKSTIFTGELSSGISGKGINQSRVSFADLRLKNTTEDVDYALGNFNAGIDVNNTSFSVETSEKKIVLLNDTLERKRKEFSEGVYDELFSKEDFENLFITPIINQLSILNKRIDSFQYLSQLEKAFLEDPFPVIYRADLLKEFDKVYIPSTRNDKEVAFGGVAEFGKHIKVVLVPEEKIKLVEGYLGENNISNVQVLAIELVEPNF